MKITLLFFLSILSFTSLSSQDLAVYEKQIFTGANAKTLPYRILYPANYDRTKAYPLVLFLHGSGERGNDNEKQLVHGARLFADPVNRSKYPAIVVFPQCPKEGYWSEIDAAKGRETGEWSYPFYEKASLSMQLVIELLDKLMADESIDESRMYVAGLSMGGFGTFDLLNRFPNRFAAAMPICGGGNTHLAQLYAPYTKLWVFHGAKDDVVPPQNSRNMVKSLKKYGADVKYTEYPEANHNSWDPAFAESDLLSWLFSHSLPSQRYQSEIFEEVEKQTFTYIQREKEALQLDLYAPKEVVSKPRPVILYVHGGGFAGGRRDEKRYVQFAERLARMGYLTASISYRLTMKGKSFSCDQPAPNKIKTFQMSVEDIRAATQFLLDKAQKLGINSEQIVLAGSSAGAEAVLHAAYWQDKHLLKNSPELPKGFRYAGLISMAGAIVDTNLITTETAIPTQLFHGTCDNLVPYGTAPHHYCDKSAVGYLMLDGAHSIAERLKTLNKSYFLLTGCTGKHEWNDKPLFDHIDEIVSFLYEDVLQHKFRQLHKTEIQNKQCKVGTHWHFCEN